MKKTFLINLLLTVALVLTFATPTFANSNITVLEKSQNDVWNALKNQIDEIGYDSDFYQVAVLSRLENMKSEYLHELHKDPAKLAIIKESIESTVYDKLVEDHFELNEEYSITANIKSQISVESIEFVIRNYLKETPFGEVISDCKMVDALIWAILDSEVTLGSTIQFIFGTTKLMSRGRYIALYNSETRELLVLAAGHSND